MPIAWFSRRDFMQKSTSGYCVMAVFSQLPPGPWRRLRPSCAAPGLGCQELQSCSAWKLIAGPNISFALLSWRSVVTRQHHLKQSSPLALIHFYPGNFVTSSYRTLSVVIALTIASLAAPSLSYAKRMGSGGRSIAPARTMQAPRPAPAVPAAPKTPAPPAAAATATPPAAPGPAVAQPQAARGPGMMGTMGAVAVGAVAGTMAGSALAGGMSSDKEAKAKEAEALTAEKDAQALQLKADEAKRKAETARAAAAK